MKKFFTIKDENNSSLSPNPAPPNPYFLQVSPPCTFVHNQG